MVFRFVLHGSKSSRPPHPRGRAWGCSPVSPEHGGDPWEMGFAGHSLLLALRCPSFGLLFYGMRVSTASWTGGYELKSKSTWHLACAQTIL